MKKRYIHIKGLMGIYENPIKQLRGIRLAELPILENAWLEVTDGHISGWGDMQTCPQDNTEEQDVKGGYIFPAFVDSHTHIVYAGSRGSEYEDKIKGYSYVEIAQRGGGILNSADLLHRTSEEVLYEQAMKRLQHCMQGGTGAIEIKSGYGLTTRDELKMLRVIRRMKETSPLTIKSNFLAAHAVPRPYKDNPDAYVDLIVNEMLPQVAAEKLADFVDVFCDEGFFTVKQTERILEAAGKWGIRPKIHANELTCSGGVQVGVKYGALSVDHLEHMGKAECDALRQTSTIATLLPGAAFFLGMPYAPAQTLIDEGLTVALASDYNPGSSPSASMKFVLSLASIKMRMTPIEALNAATVNGAFAMGLEETHGHIRKGLPANFIITKPMSSFAYFSYAYTEDLIAETVINRT